VSFLDATITCLPIILILYQERYKDKAKFIVVVNFAIIIAIIAFWEYFNKANALFSLLVLVVGILFYASKRN
jgi:hypothetical protein